MESAFLPAWMLWCWCKPTANVKRRSSCCRLLPAGDTLFYPLRHVQIAIRHVHNAVLAVPNYPIPTLLHHITASSTNINHRLQYHGPSAITPKSHQKSHQNQKQKSRWRNKANHTCKCHRCSTGCTNWRLLLNKPTSPCNSNNSCNSNSNSTSTNHSTNYSTNKFHRHRSHNRRNKASRSSSSVPTSRWPSCPHPRTVSTTRGMT